MMNRRVYNRLPKIAAPIFDELMSEFFNTGVSRRPNGLTLSTPSVNIRKEDKAYLLEFAAPGLKKEDFKLEVEKDQLIISAEMKSEETDEKKNFSRREFNYSAFKRSFHLNEEIDTNEISASYEAGVLLVTLPKKEEVMQKAKEILVS